MAVKRIHDGHNSVSPYLIVAGAERALDFYKRAFGATELFRQTRRRTARWGMRR